LLPYFNIQHSALKKAPRFHAGLFSGFAADPAPQQLTAPCRKYSGRLHHTIEQSMYRPNS
jgi:hypothetical protein